MTPKGAGALAVGCAALGAYRVTMSSSSQAFGPFPFRSDSSTKIALTFDDGPNEPFTTEIADFLESEDIRATFFQVGSAVRRFPEVTARLAAAGHVVGNHSDTHRFSRCLTRRTLEVEIAEADRAFADVGLAPALYRPPWLLRVPALFPILRDHGLTPVSGTFCHPLEVAQIDPGRISDAAVRRSSAGSIVIFHDGYNGGVAERVQTVAAVKSSVRALKARGCEFATVDEMLGVPAYRSVTP
jgi:peptidoglycan/xylan/chitin deacetylase (PgdA/CDA1 family)